MSIVVASHQDVLFRAALQYLEAGISVIPVRGKQASVAWSKFQTERAPFSYLHNWNRAGLMPNIALVCGAVSGNLVVMDLDGLQAVSHFESCFPHLLDTFTVVSGSGNGKHYYYFTETPTPTTRTKGYELRSDGCYVVAPPSIHPVSGKQYQANWTEVMRVHDLLEVEAWIKGMIIKQAPARVPSVLPAIRKTGQYGSVALRNECENVRTATSDVNNALNRAAFKLGQLVGRGLLDYGECESALLGAAAGLSKRDGERSTLATIKSGLNAGMTKASIYRSGLKHDVR